MLSKDTMDFLKSLVLTEFIASAPVKTGELLNSIVLEETDSGFSISITAPHTVYTEETWISPKWDGKTNPNEKWILQAFERSFNKIREYFGALEDKELDKEDYPVPEVVKEYVEQNYGD